VGRAPVPRLAEDRALSIARRLEAMTDALADALRDHLPPPRPGLDELRAPMPGDLWSRRPAQARAPLTCYQELDVVLEEAATVFARLAENDPGAVHVVGSAPPGAPPEITAVMGGLASRAQALRDDLAAFVNPARRDEIHWVVASPRNVSLRTSPIDVAPLLGRAFDAHPGPLVFTSATLTAGGTFAYIRRRVGLGDSAAEAVFPSPFRYEEQALLYLPGDLPDPTDARFPDAAAERALELCRLSRGRALILFTSFRNLRHAESRFRRAGEFPLLVQGERSRHHLLEALRSNVGSVLLATQSFWEGVDVPGEALSLVVIDRLPFAVPDDPLTAARIDRLREDDEDPFTSYQLPRAALALKQGFGRLVRTRRDRGVVALLDGRITRKTYGAVLLGSLPPECPRSESLADVAAFFAPD
jgi:ATP-dependent DNA helicase DinG